MKVIDAHPPQAPGRRPHCEALLSAQLIERNEMWKKRGMLKGLHRNGAPVDHCGCFARYLLDGKWYCRKHAALTLLDHMAIRATQPQGAPTDGSHG